MTVLRVDQPHSRWSMSQWVQDAAQIVGERLIVFEMWNSQNVTPDIHRCRWCWDEFYAQSDTTTGICKHCFGTTYAHGIRLAHFTSGIISAINTTSEYDSAKGEYDTASVTGQFSADIELHEKDLVVRVDGWKMTEYGATPILGEVWQVRDNFNDSYLKDGFSYLGQSHRIGCQVPLGKIVSYRHPILDVLFKGMDERLVSDGQPFILYDPAVPIFDWSQKHARSIKTVGDVSLISARDYSDFKLAHFR